MPKIPDVQSLGEANINVQTPVARVNVSQAGQGLSALGRAFEQREQLRAKNQYNKARTKFLSDYTVTVNSFDERTDYKKFGQDYEQDIQKSLDDAADMIEDGRTREQFIQETRLKIVEGQERVRNIALSREKDAERGDLFDNLNTTRSLAAEADESNLTDIIDNTVNMLDTAADLGYITREERAKTLQDWKQKVAVSRIEAMDPEKRTEALDSQFAQMIPPDVKQQLREQAEQEAKDLEAIDIVDGYITSGITRAEAMKKMRNINDDVLRASVESRFDYQYNKAQLANTETQKELHDTYATGLSDPGSNFTIDNIPEEDWAAMDFDTRNNLYKIQQQAAKPRTSSDPDALVDLAALSAVNDAKGIVEYLNKNSHRLSAADRVKYSEIGIKGQIPAPVKDGLTLVQRVNGKLTELDINDKSAKDVVLNKVGDWMTSYQERNNGKLPDDKEQREFIDRMLIELQTGFFSSNKRMYEYKNISEILSDIDVTDEDFTEEQANAVIQQISDVDPEGLATVLREADRLGMSDMTPVQVITGYQNLINEEGN